MSDSTAVLRAAARQFLDRLDAAGRAAAAAPFSTADRTVWTYLPGPRPGVAVGDLDDAARADLDELLGVTLSAMGADRTRQVMNLDDVLREVERSVGRTGWERRGSERYWVRVLGDPDDEVWAWHLGGHHVGVHATVVGDAVAITPSFLGANPAVVRGGPHAGLQVLREEESLARDLLGALDADQRGVAVVSPDAPDDIATRHDPVADPDAGPVGAAARRARPVPGAAARGAGAVVPRAGAGGGRRAGVAGGGRRRSRVGDVRVGRVARLRASRHYYAVKGETFLLEYDNTQDGANHAHTVWRDLRRDWGTDLLAEHHAEAHG